MTQENTENLTSPINNKGRTSLAQTLNQCWFINKFYQVPKEEIMPIINFNNPMHPRTKWKHS